MLKEYFKALENAKLAQAEYWAERKKKLDKELRSEQSKCKHDFYGPQLFTDSTPSGHVIQRGWAVVCRLCGLKREV